MDFSPRPGDRLVLRWLKVQNEPVTAYIIVAVTGDRFWYLSEGTPALRTTLIDAIKFGADKGQLIVDLLPGR